MITLKEIGLRGKIKNSFLGQIKFEMHICYPNGDSSWIYASGAHEGGLGLGYKFENH